MGITTLLTRFLPAFSHLDALRVPEFMEMESEVPPEQIFDLLPDFGLSIVGTRHPEPRSLEQIEQTLAALRSTRLVILSGFARGVDAHAHRMAIRCGLRTLAILGCGIDIPYPRGNRELRKQILDQGGALLSPFPRGTPPWAANFLERNAFIAGLSKATWVVEAGAASGTLNTANWATRMNRDLYATSCFPGDPRFEGNEKLLSQRRTDRYPVATSFFGPHSLSSTWPELSSNLHETPASSRFRAHETLVQKWVHEIKKERGACYLPALMSRASREGITRGVLFEMLEAEIRKGLLIQEADGQVVPCFQTK